MPSQCNKVVSNTHIAADSFQLHWVSAWNVFILLISLIDKMRFIWKSELTHCVACLVLCAMVDVQGFLGGL